MVDKELETINTKPQQELEQMQQLVQAGQIDPMVAQQRVAELQQQGPEQFNPEQVESRVAQVEAELLKELAPLLAFKGNDESSEDPLVQIRMQELSIKEMEANNKIALEQAKLELEGMKVEQRAVTDSARLELQEGIAEERTEVNRERIDVQREAMLRRG
jgi:hypothetical protein